MINLIRNHKLVFLITLALFIIPFFWLKPNEMDLGGDSSRLYFYDPLSYTLTTLLYVLLPSGNGYIDSGVFSPLPQMALLIALQSFLHSPYLLITIFSITKVVIGFLAVYAITKELLNQKSDSISSKFSEFASILAGLFYILSHHMVSNYVQALLYHNQVFLNPLMFYLLLKYLLTKDKKYGWFALIVSFIFASSFSYLASPPFFSFYPLAILFLLAYVVFIRRIQVPWKGLFFGLLIFLGLQAFHIVPVIFDILQKGSHVNIRLFNKDSLSEQVQTFFGILQLARLDRSLFLPSWHEKLRIFSILFPSVLVVGFLLNKQRGRAILLTGVFFLITFFLLTAKVTQAGIYLYSKLFYIPGFSLFRNFTGIWTYVYSFFYALLFGLSIFYVLKRFSYTWATYVFMAVALIIVLSAWPFLDGTMVNPVHYQSKNVKTAIVMDPLFEETLSYIKSLPNDSKLLTLPFTDCCMQVLYGTNNAAYMGPSMIGYLAGKSDYTGYANAAPFSELFFNLAKEKDYASFKQMLGLLNVQYIFHNADPRILDNFPIYPFSPSYVRKYFPNNQEEYTEFVKNLSSKKIFGKNTYNIYLLDEKYFLPHFYTAKRVSFYDNNPSYNQYYARASSFFPPNTADRGINDPRVIFVDRQWCETAFLEQVCSSSFDALDSTPKIFFEKINRTKYRLKIHEVSTSYILVFSEIFNTNWKLIDPTNTGEDVVSRSDKMIASYFNDEISEGEHANIFLEPKTFETWGKREIAKDSHFEVNGYANAWYIRPEDMGGQKDYELILELTNQRIIYMVLPISLIFFVAFLFWGILLYNNSRK